MHKLDREIDDYLSDESAPRERPKRPRTLTKAILDKAVDAMRVYLGSIGRVRWRDEQRLHQRVIAAVERVVSKAQGTIDYPNAWNQIRDEARRRGTFLALPGKDI